MKINLHCHSKYSDGGNTLEELANEHKEQGFDAFVITDHLYSNMYPNIFLTRETYADQTAEIVELSKRLDYPIIQGVELSLYGEEVLIFGQTLIGKIFSFLEGIKGKYVGKGKYALAIDIMSLISDDSSESAIILCHPRLGFEDDDIQLFYETLFPILDGYEQFNGGHNWFKNRDMPKELVGKKAFKNSDAHSLSMVCHGDNITLEAITNEVELINYVKL